MRLGLRRNPGIGTVRPTVAAGGTGPSGIAIHAPPLAQERRSQCAYGPGIDGARPRLRSGNRASRDPTGGCGISRCLAPRIPRGRFPKELPRPIHPRRCGSDLLRRLGKGTHVALVHRDVMERNEGFRRSDNERTTKASRKKFKPCLRAKPCRNPIPSPPPPKSPLCEGLAFSSQAGICFPQAHGYTSRFTGSRHRPHRLSRRRQDHPPQPHPHRQSRPPHRRHRK